MLLEELGSILAYLTQEGPYVDVKDPNKATDQDGHFTLISQIVSRVWTQ